MQSFVILRALLFAAVLCGTPSIAQSASSQWIDLGGGKARLLAQADPATGMIDGVVEFVLDDGWKTYWRDPGSSGIPPTFDFTRSTGFSVGEVKFPTPQWIVLPDAEFAGYRGIVRFPFEAEMSPISGATLRLSLFAGVCKDICIPAMGDMEILAEALNRSDPQASLAIGQARLSLPVKPDERQTVLSVTVGEDDMFTARAQTDAADPLLLVETPAGWRMGRPLPQKAENGIVEFRTRMTRLDGAAARDAMVFRVLLIDGDRAVEQMLAVEK